MAQTHKLTRTANTKWAGTYEAGRVKLYNTVVIEWNADTITIRTGGYETATTRTRINQASSHFGLGVGVGSEKRQWYVHGTHGTRAALLGEAATINRATGEITQ